MKTLLLGITRRGRRELLARRYDRIADEQQRWADFYADQHSSFVAMGLDQYAKEAGANLWSRVVAARAARAKAAQIRRQS